VKVLSNFRPNLVVRHPIDGFNAHDARLSRLSLLSRFCSWPLASPGPNIKMDSASRIHVMTAS
jgi:hypothetical protein